MPWPPAKPGKLPTLGAVSRTHEGNDNEAHETINILPLTTTAAFRISGQVLGSTVSFLLDTGAALTLVRKDVWDSLGLTRPRLEPWSGLRLVSVDGNPLSVLGCAQTQLNLAGEEFQKRIFNESSAPRQPAQ